MTARERWLAALNHQEPDRVPIHDSPWFTTVRRWRKEGLSEDESPDDYFGYELVGQGADRSMRLPTETLEETDEYKVVRDSNGAVIRDWKGKTSTPECRSFLITNRDIWNAHKHLMEGDDYRVNWASGLANNKRWRLEGKFIYYDSSAGYDYMQHLTGTENLLMALITDPEWAADMFMTSAEVAVDMGRRMMKGGFQFDAAFTNDDLGYRNGLLFSPRIYKELLAPAHKLICDYFHSQNLPVLLHSCGNVKALIPLLIESGFDCLQPLEVKAGMDLIELKKKYGDKLAFMGGIDVRKMALDDPGPIEEEIRTKFAVAKKGGGYIYHSDHSVPDDVSFQSYCRVMELVRKYGEYQGTGSAIPPQVRSSEQHSKG